MFRHNFFTYGGQLLFQIIWEILYFPFWWYSVGFVRTLRNARNFLRNQSEILGFFVWLKNLFRPMYGQHDFAGKAISFFIRLAQIFARGLGMLFFLLLAIIFVIFYLAIPIILILIIVYQLS
jgi:hypothetical protein